MKDGHTVVLVTCTLEGNAFSGHATVQFRDEHGTTQAEDVTLIPEGEQRNGATHRDEKGFWYAGLSSY